MSTSYNQRQIDLMKQKITEYRSNKLSIRDLLDYLEPLSNILEDIDEADKLRLISAIGELDDIYAYAVYDNKTDFDLQDKEDITKILKKIEFLIDNPVYH